MNGTVKFFNKGREEDIEISFNKNSGFSIVTTNYVGDNCYIHGLTVSDLVKVKHAIEEVIFKSQ